MVATTYLLATFFSYCIVIFLMTVFSTQCRKMRGIHQSKKIMVLLEILILKVDLDIVSFTCEKKTAK